MSVSEESSTRARIRDAALEQFGRDGVNRVTVRTIAGASPALVVHHFGSKEALRRECDAYVVAMMRGTDGTRGTEVLDDAVAGNATRLSSRLESAAPVRRYLARAFLDDSPAAAALFDEIIELTTTWLGEGERDGWPGGPRTRAAVYVTWLPAPLVFDQRLARVLDVHDLHDTAPLPDRDRDAHPRRPHRKRALEAWDAVREERQAR